jgi:hypothetical protein
MKEKQGTPSLRVSPGGGRVKNKKKKNSGRGKKRFFAALAGAAGLFLVLLFWQILRPRPVWLVEPAFQDEWGRIVRQSAVPFRKTEPLPPGAGIPEKKYGFIVTRNLESFLPEGVSAPPVSGAGNAGIEAAVAPELPELNLAAGGGVRVYPWLSQTREWKGALAVAVNPWIVFYKRDNPVLTRNRVESPGGGPGNLILPGGDPGAVEAWLAQLLQESPGVFPADSSQWAVAADRLFGDRRFQPGAGNFRWLDVWPLFFRDEPAWVYAPVSRIRELPSYRLGLLEGARFPEKSDWTRFGVQADVLWAIPFGTARQLKKLSAAAGWLNDPVTQAEIANVINWVPAHPAGVPYNPVTWEAQVAWIMSSFVWQGTEQAGEPEN